MIFDDEWKPEQPEPHKTIKGSRLGMPDGPYEILEEGCYRRLPADVGQEGD